MKPSFKTLWDSYPANPRDLDGVEKYPCRYPDDPGRYAFDNQCAIRVGLALDRAGMDFRQYRGAKCWFKGHNGHILRAQELANWLNGQLGGAKKYIKQTHGDKPGLKALQELQGSTGIIIFRDFWGPGSSGDHIDLWNNDRAKTVRNNAYFEPSKEVWFWHLS